MTPAVTAERPETGAPRRLGVPWWVPVVIVLVALNLRPAVVAVGPLLGRIRADLALSATAAGVLTALPVVCFGLLAPVAPRLARRIGIERAMLAALLTLVAGCLVRSIPTLWGLYGGTIAIGAAIASGNVLLPALIKRDFAHRAGFMTALYSTSISLGGALGAGLTIPVATALGLDWRMALGSWALFGLLATLCWIPQVRRVARPDGGRPRVGGLARQALAWQVTLFMGLQSLGFYAAASWLPAVFESRGIAPATAGMFVAVMSLAGIVGGMIGPMVAVRLRHQSGVALAVTALTVVGVAIVLLVPGAELLGVIVMGIAQGGSLGVALILMTLRAPDTAHAAQLSGMAQCIGYVLAAAGPFAVGALHDLTAGWTVPLLALLVVCVPQAIAGALAGRDRLVRPATAPQRTGAA